jgi:hypothetical protein
LTLGNGLGNEQAIRFTANIHKHLCFNSKSHNSPPDKQDVLSNLIYRDRSLCDQDSLRSELDFLRTTFRQNGYSDRQIPWPLNPTETVALPPEKPASVASLADVSETFNRISRLLSRYRDRDQGAPTPHRLQPDKSAVAENSIYLGHRIKLQDSAILSKMTYMD